MKRFHQALAVVLGCLLVVPAPVRAMPVVDLTNFAQNLLTALENVDQTLQAVESYQTQLAEYEELIKNTLAVPVNTWDRIQSINTNLKTLAKDSMRYRHYLMALDEHFRKFGDLEYYRSAKCYGSNIECPKGEWERILDQAQQDEKLAGEAVNKTVEDMVRHLEENEEALVEDTERLENLQQESQSTEGQLAATQAGNEIAAAQVQQLMQIRALMNAQYRVLLVERQAKAVEDARGKALSKRYRRPILEDKKKNGGLDDPSGLGRDPWTF